MSLLFFSKTKVQAI